MFSLRIEQLLKAIFIFILALSLSEAVIAKSCQEYRSCTEVISDYPNGHFGRRDRDKDGIPSENLCRSKKQVEVSLKAVSDTNK